MLHWLWPHTSWPVWPDEPGRFGIPRRHDVHTGVDLYCELGAGVVAVEDGQVVKIETFTGPSALPPTPWWNDTQAVLIEGASGVVVYGEMTARVMVGDRVQRGQIIGLVDRPVLPKFKGRPMVMLHLELLRPGARETLVWGLGQPQPDLLLDPEPHLQACGVTLRPFSLDTWDRASFLPPGTGVKR